MLGPLDPLRSGPQLRAWRTGRWLTARDLTGPLVIFVHGFTATSVSISELASHVDAVYQVAVYDYVSHEGIDKAADDLAHRLERLAGRLDPTGFALIGHSMGGLVAKYFARHAPQLVREPLKGLATLGTPHGGTLRTGIATVKRRLLTLMLDLGERHDEPNPYLRSLISPAAKQLIGSDAHALLDRLLQADRLDPLPIPVLTVSGGLNYLELFQPGTPWNAAANRILQSCLAMPNDGLVEESSASLASCVPGAPPSIRHRNDYVAWSRTNHTHLPTNQDVGELVLEWLADEVFTG